MSRIPLPPRLLLSALSGILLCQAAPHAQKESGDEHKEALQNKSYVETCDPSEQRQVEAALELLRDGKARAALTRLLPFLTEKGQYLQVRWTTRETRSLGSILDPLLRSLPPKTRAAFREGLEKPAREAIASASNSRPALRSILARFPGTESALTARKRLVDLLLESSEGLAASRQLPLLPPAMRAEREKVLRTLGRAARHGSTSPYDSGQRDGSSSELELGPVRKRPKRLVGPGSPDYVIPGLTGTAVGQTEKGNAFVAFQSPFGLHVVIAATSQRRFHPLLKLSGVLGAVVERPAPSAVGRRLYLAHGNPAQDPSYLRLRPDRRPLSGKILALEVQEDGELRKLWDWQPRRLGRDGKAHPVLLHPFALATATHVYALYSDSSDRLNTQVFLACLSKDGKLLWTRFLAQGAPLTRDIVELRQEDLGRGMHRPAAPILAGGYVIASTGLGVLCAVNPRNGRIVWTFRSARLSALGEREQPWDRGKLTRLRDSVVFAPSDGRYLYTLRLSPGADAIQARSPVAKRSLATLLTSSDARSSLYFLRRGLVEQGPVRLRFTRSSRDGERYDAPPIQSSERFLCASSGADRLLLASTGMLYMLDLTRDLFYESAFDMGRSGLGLVAGVAPTKDGWVLLAKRGILLWR